ncbi:MAG: glycosyltransferase [Pseudomonadota bacterium]
MNQPIITVIIPSYNHADYIGSTIESILAQTENNFELLIIDDLSSDNSLEIIKKFQDPRIKLITLQKNIGMCQTSNIGIEQAKGKYISIIASDDVMLPNNLQDKINFLEKNPAYGAVFSRVEAIDENGDILYKKTKKFKKLFITDKKNRYQWLNHFFYKANCLAAPTMVAQTEVIRKINGFNPIFSQAHDFDMWVKICLTGYEIFVLEEKMVQYRQRKNFGNMSSNTAKVRVRLVFDNEKILENYLVIDDVEQLLKIFPHLSKTPVEKDLIPFFIAMEALKLKDSTYHQQFGLSCIYKLMNDEETRKKLEEKLNFTIMDFFEIVNLNPLGLGLELNKKKRFLRNIKRFFCC